MTLETRFDAVQDQILSLYEKASSQLSDQITYWGLVRQEGALEFYARRKGLNSLGLHTVPTQACAESKAKKAIHMQLQLKSLACSPYGQEPWTMSDTSIEMFERTNPSGAFKKHGEEVDVWFDGDQANSVSYMLWGAVYVQDDEGWLKCESSVDNAGIYYTDRRGQHVYYQRFDKEAARYGTRGEWTVNYKNVTLTSCPDSTKESSSCTTPELPRRRRERTPDPDEPQKKIVRGGATTPTHHRASRPRAGLCVAAIQAQEAEEEEVQFGLGQGEHTPGRRDRERERSRTPQQVGRGAEEAGGGTPRPERGCPGRHRTVPVDAGHSPIVLVKGRTNALKCWRNRLRRRHYRPFVQISTAFSWVDERDSSGITNLLIAFADHHQRDVFLKTVPMPSGTVVIRGSLDGL